MRIVLIATLLSLSLSSVDADVTRAQINVSVRSSGAVLVPMTINGHGPFPFLLDTGSSHSMVTDELAFVSPLRQWRRHLSRRSPESRPGWSSNWSTARSETPALRA